MDFTGLDGLAEKPIDGLSKGMKQRLCLGRAHDPRSGRAGAGRAGRGTRPRARIELREMIRQLAADGKTILISSHILTELAEMCDRWASSSRAGCWRSARSRRSNAAPAKRQPPGRRSPRVLGRPR